MSRAAAIRIAVLTVLAAALAVVVRALRGPGAPVFSAPAPTDGLLVPPPSVPDGVPTDHGSTPDHSPADPPAGVQPSDVTKPDPAPTPEPEPGEAGPGPVETGAPPPGHDPERPNPPGERWVFPIDGGCPPTHPIKAKLRSGIYHLPGMMAYDRARPDRCYATEVDARADGLRRAKR